MLRKIKFGSKSNILIKVISYYVNSKMTQIPKIVLICLCIFILLDDFASAAPPSNSTIVRKKRYLDFIPKSRMFVSVLPFKFNKIIYPLYKIDFQNKPNK